MEIVYSLERSRVSASRRLGSSSMITLIQPAIGMAMMAPINPNMYIPITMAVRTSDMGKLRASPWILVAMRLFSTWA